VLDSALDHAIVTLDLDGRVTGWNCGAEASPGYPAEEAIGPHRRLLLTPEDRAEGVFTFELCRALDGGRATNERWHLRRDGTRFWASGAMLPITDRFGETSGFLNIWRDATETHAAAEQRQLLLSEMNHRVKNTLATVRAVAAQTEHHARTPHDFAESFEARLLALARSNDLLIRGGWKDVPLRELVAGVTAAYPDRFTVSGLPVLLPAALVVPLSLAFHELATNAAKYGALSTSEGRVAVGWRVHPAGRDGPPHRDRLGGERRPRRRAARPPRLRLRAAGARPAQPRPDGDGVPPRGAALPAAPAAHPGGAARRGSRDDDPPTRERPDLAGPASRRGRPLSRSARRRTTARPCGPPRSPSPGPGRSCRPSRPRAPRLATPRRLCGPPRWLCSVLREVAGVILLRVGHCLSPLYVGTPSRVRMNKRELWWLVQS
jgi:PAS domain S-box-containing protein